MLDTFGSESEPTEEITLESYQTFLASLIPDGSDRISLREDIELASEVMKHTLTAVAVLGGDRVRFILNANVNFSTPLAYASWHASISHVVIRRWYLLNK